MKRPDKKKDGCCILYKHDKFDLIERHEIQYDKICEEDEEIKEKCTTENYKRHNVGLCLEFNEKKSNIHFIVVCTHLFWDPLYEEVKLSQVKYLINYINEMNKLKKIGVIVCGDFNSLPNSNVYNHVVNKDSDVDDEEKIKFESVYGSTVGEPEFTTYTETFTATIDYIFFSKNKIIPKEVLMIDTKCMEGVKTLPDEKHGSDHLLIGCELEFII